TELKEQGSKIVFDPGPLVDQIDIKMLFAVLHLTDIFLPNRREVKLLEKKLNLREPFHSWCLARNGSLIVEKDGAHPFYSYTKEQTLRHTPFKVAVLDTTGAGDSFAAGLIFGLLQDSPSLARAIQFACACGALTATFSEPHQNFSVETIEKLIQTQGVLE
ncbi:MAG: PfkB family carbohydrate kinase, partial [Spirochaetota bacterium]